MELLPAIANFNEAYPDIELEIDVNDRFVDVINEGFDAVIRSGDPKDSRLRSRKLGEFAWRFVASPSYLKRAGKPETLAELSQHRCLRQRLAETGRLLPWPTGDELDVTSLPVTIAATAMGPVLDLARRGRGIAYLPDFAVENCIEAGELVVVLDEVHEEKGSLHLLWPSSRYPLSKVRVFVDFMATRLSQVFRKP